MATAGTGTTTTPTPPPAPVRKRLLLHKKFLSFLGKWWWVPPAVAYVILVVIPWGWHQSVLQKDPGVKTDVFPVASDVGINDVTTFTEGKHIVVDATTAIAAAHKFYTPSHVSVKKGDILVFTVWSEGYYFHEFIGGFGDHYRADPNFTSLPPSGFPYTPSVMWKDIVGRGELRARNDYGFKILHSGCGCLGGVIATGITYGSNDQGETVQVPIQASEHFALAGEQHQQIVVTATATGNVYYFINAPWRPDGWDFNRGTLYSRLQVYR